MKEEKKALRARLREQLAQFPMEEQEKASGLIQARLEKHPWVQKARELHCYVGIPGEVHTLPFIEKQLSQGRKLNVPVVVDVELVCMRLNRVSELKPGPLDIPEPPVEEENRVPLETIDTFIVPGLGFDRQGNRLGRGRGYYDRLLRGSHRDARFIGVGFEMQLVEKVPMKGYDVPVHAVVTEKRVIEKGD